MDESATHPNFSDLVLSACKRWYREASFARDSPYEGIIVFNFSFQAAPFIFDLKQLFNRSSMIETDVEAPGEAPSSAAIVPSDD